MKNMLKKGIVAVAAVSLMVVAGLQTVQAETIKVGAILAVTGGASLIKT